MTTSDTATTASENRESPKKTLPTHELWDVQERPNQKAFWNKVGAAFENKDGSHSLLVYQPGFGSPRRLQLRVIDRSIRPLKDGADPKKSPTHELFVVIDVEDGSKEWKRVGVGFTNKDGSLSLIIDEGNREGPKARFQLRPWRERKAGEPEPSPPAPSAPPPPAAQTRTMVRKRQAA